MIINIQKFSAHVNEIYAKLFVVVFNFIVSISLCLSDENQLHFVSTLLLSSFIHGHITQMHFVFIVYVWLSVYVLVQ